MSRCHRCNVEILDETIVCPLCHGVLEREDDGEIEHSRSLMYPDITQYTKKLEFIFKIIAFSAMLVEILLIVINYLTYNGVKWSAICGLGLAYICFVAYYAYQRNSGHRAKVLVLFLLAMPMFFVMDYVLGYEGWSLDYASPIMIMVIDIVIIVLMLVNVRNWQNYIMMQIVMLFVCIVGMVLVMMDVIGWPVLMIIATGVTGIIFVGTIVFGDKKAMVELFRQFKM